MWMFPVAIGCGNTFVLKPSERDPTLSMRMASCCRKRDCRTACSTSCMATRKRSTRCSRTRSQRGIVRRLDADRQIHLRDGRAQRQARAGAGRRQEPCGRLPDADLDFATRSDHRRRLRLRGRALHGHLGGRRRGRCRPTRWSSGSPTRARRVTVGPGDAPSIEMGPVITCAARDRITGYIDRGVGGGRDAGGRRPPADDRRPRRRFLRRADAVRSRASPPWRSTAKRSSVRCSPSCASNR